MDFFQAQDAARRRSRRLVFHFAAAVLSIVAVLYAVAVALTRSTGNGPVAWWQPGLFGGVAVVTLGVILGGSLFKTLSLRGGGGVVARSLGGVLVHPGTRDAAERRLLNVVEEMALASGVRVPEVYLLPEDGINAFAAGHAPDDAAIGVTRGALATLSRDELQGVIAHEFSHILNGDMRLNIRLIGLLFGILLLAVLGRGLLHSLRFSRMRSSGRGRGGGNGVVVLLAAGVALLVVGSVGVLFGRLIQAAVSRQREFLADASAVQFTRNPDGIAGALRRIGALSAGSRIANAHATETSHLFFANALRGSALDLFATHPPLDARIRAIDPSFDGVFKPAAPRPPPAPPVQPRPPPPLRPEGFLAAVAAASADAGSGAALLATIPDALRDAAHDPALAPGLVLALVAPAPATPARALAPDDAAVVARLLPETRALATATRLALVDLALPTLRQTRAADAAAFLAALDSLIESDSRITLFEHALRRVIARHHAPATRAADATILSLDALIAEVSIVLSLIARAGGEDPARIRRAFDAGAGQLGPIRDRLRFEPPPIGIQGLLADALARLERASPPLKKSLLAALARAAAEDGELRPAEVETLRAVAAAIACPAPPIARPSPAPG